MSTIDQKPNCFLVGAPKCGTTSLARYLEQHPEVFLCDPKEPCYWSPEIPKDSSLSGYYGNDLKSYLNLFSKVKRKHKAIVDASTSYLWSKSAIESIIQFNPKAKFIVMIRNPVELAHSLHWEEVYSTLEPEESFEKAWQLQKQRKDLSINKDLKNPLKLQYKWIASIGTQLQRASKQINPKNLLVIKLEDLKNSPQDTFQNTLKFLDLSEFELKSYKIHNSAKTHRYKSIVKFLQDPPSPLKPFFQNSKRVLQFLGIKGVRSSLIKLQTKNEKKPRLNESMKHLLIEEFSAEIRQVEQLLDQNLNHWRT